MAIVRQTLIYDGPGGPFEGVVAWEDEVETPRPGVLVCPNILGQKEADNEKAEALAKLGYVALACDVYGQGKRTTRESPDAGLYMNQMNADRALLRDRLAAALDALRGFGPVDATRIAAIGFCFGGKCVLDMTRSGLPILGGVSFHGVYDRPDYANVPTIEAKLLICHGWEDPLATPEQMVALGRELTDAHADWQIHAYGNAGHAFTDTALVTPAAPGVAYDEPADRRSWKAMSDFLAELFV